MPKPRVFCSLLFCMMTVALVYRRSQMPGTVPIPYRCHCHPYSCPLGWFHEPLFVKGSQGLGNLCTCAASPRNLFSAFYEGGNSERLLAL